MTDRRLRFDIDANTDSAKREIESLRREFEKVVTALKGQDAEIKAFKAAERDAAKLEAQIKRTAKAGGETGGLQATLEAQRAALAAQAAALAKSGIDTNALAAAQANLKAQIAAATAGFNQQKAAVSARDLAAQASAKAASDAAEKQTQAVARREQAEAAAAARARAFGQQRLADLQAESRAREQAAAAAARIQADQVAAQRAAAANARVLAGQQSAAAQQAQNEARAALISRQAVARTEMQRRALAGMVQAQEQAQQKALALASAQRQVQAASMDAAGAFQAGRSQLLAYASAALSVGAAIQGIKAVTTAGKQLEALNASLLFSTGSAEAAASAYAFVKAEAERLGLPLDVLGKQFSSLSASARGTELEGQATRDIFTSVASAARVMGLESYQVERALLAVQQIMSKGSVQAEELRGQLGEQIPGSFQIAARAMGVTTEELDKLLKTGQVTATEFLPRFADELQRTVDPAVPKAVSSYAAQIERLRNQFTLFLQEVGQSGALEAITEQVIQFTEQLKAMRESGELEPLVRDLVAALSLFARGMAEVGEFLAQNGQALLYAAAAYAAFRAAVLAVRFGGFLSGLVKSTTVAGEATTAVSTLAGVAGKLGSVLKLAFRGALPIAAGLLAVDYVLELVAAHNKLAEAKRKSAEEFGKQKARADIGLIENADAKDTAVLDLARVQKLTEAEVDSYQQRLDAAEAYYDSLADQQSLAAGAAAGQSSLSSEAARRDADRYRAGLAEVKKVLADREAAEKATADRIGRIKRDETATIKAAIDAQVGEVKRLRGELEAASKGVEAAAARGAEFRQKLAGGSGVDPASARAWLDVNEAVTRLREQFREGIAPEAAQKQVETLRARILELREAGQSEFSLQGFARALEEIDTAAAVQSVSKAEAAVQDAENALFTLTEQAKQLEAIKVGADVSAAEQQMRELLARVQAFYDANPVVLKALVQRENDLAIGLDKLPAKAGGGRLHGPGTPTSDSILMWGSKDEFMLRAAAARRIGYDRLEYMNRTGKIPGFAAGGAIARSVASLPSPASAASSGGGGDTIHLTLPGLGTFTVQASRAQSTSLQRAALAVGGRR